ncbi:MAG: hypothetical protein KF878_26350 [Planctomycetes bacterium]|nr:hypothetical protein [Planctomycetota bacterium]
MSSRTSLALAALLCLGCPSKDPAHVASEASDPAEAEALAFEALRALEKAQERFRLADLDGDGRLNHGDLAALERNDDVLWATERARRAGYELRCEPSRKAPEWAWFALATPREGRGRALLLTEDRVVLALDAALLKDLDPGARTLRGVPVGALDRLPEGARVWGDDAPADERAFKAAMARQDVEALIRLGPPAVPLLARAVERGAPEERAAALEALEGAQQPPLRAVPALVRTLQASAGGMDWLTVSAARALGACGPLAGPEALEALLEAAAVPPLCTTASLSIVAMGPAARPALPRLLALAREGPARGSRFLLHAVSRLGFDDPAAIDLLRDLLDDDAAQASAVAALRTVGAAGEPALPRLRALAFDEGAPAHVRADALTALGRIAPLGPEDVAALLALLASPRDDGLPDQAAVILAGAPPRREVLEALERSADISGALWALTLHAARDDGARERLAACLGRGHLRDAVVWELATTDRWPAGRAPSTLVQPLLALVTSGGDRDHAAAAALGRLGAREALPALRQALEAAGGDGDRRLLELAIVRLERGG